MLFSQFSRSQQGRNAFKSCIDLCSYAASGRISAPVVQLDRLITFGVESHPVDVEQQDWGKFLEPVAPQHVLLPVHLT